MRILMRKAQTSQRRVENVPIQGLRIRMRILLRKARFRYVDLVARIVRFEWRPPMEEIKATRNCRVGIRPFNAKNAVQSTPSWKARQTWKKKKPLTAALFCMRACIKARRLLMALKGRMPTLPHGVAFFPSIEGCRFVFTSSRCHALALMACVRACVFTSCVRAFRIRSLLHMRMCCEGHAQLYDSCFCFSCADSCRYTKVLQGTCSTLRRLLLFFCFTIGGSLKHESAVWGRFQLYDSFFLLFA